MVREITIMPVLNGFVCRVGCQTVVVNSIEALVDGIRDYYRNPKETEKKWISSALNKTMDLVAPAEQSSPGVGERAPAQGLSRVDRQIASRI